MTGLTPLGIAALALLVERPMHPYEMYQTLVHRREDRNVKVRPGSLYHAIDRLVREGFVEAVGVDREGNRPERTSYAITAAGCRALDERIVFMLATPAEEYPEFRHAVAQAHNLPANEVVDLLRSRRAILADGLTTAELTEHVVGTKRIPERFWLDAHYQSTMLRAELDWLDATIERIAGGQLDWTEPVPEHNTEKNN